MQRSTLDREPTFFFFERILPSYASRPCLSTSFCREFATFSASGLRSGSFASMSFKTGIIAENFGSIFDTSGLKESHADSRSFAALFEEGLFDRLFIASINVLEWTGVRVNIVYRAAPNA